METTSATPVLSAATPRTRGFNELKSEDFLKLLITQLTSQDPLEPTGNEELIQQISSIRNIELSTTLTDSLRSLTGEQRFGSASSLIGQFVSGAPDESGIAVSGVVSAVRFDADGRPTLQLANGSTLPLDGVATIEHPLRAAEALIGQSVTGVDRTTTATPQPTQGLVTGVTVDDGDDVMLELDTGGRIRFRDVWSVAPENA